VLEGCDVEAKKTGVRTEAAARAECRTTRVSAGERGITIGRGGFVRIEGSTITGCLHSAVDVAAGGLASLTQAGLTNNPGVAVSVAGGGAITAPRCDLTNNIGGSWSVSGSGAAVRRLDNLGDTLDLKTEACQSTTTACPNCGERFEYTLPGPAVCPSQDCRGTPLDVRRATNSNGGPTLTSIAWSKEDSSINEPEPGDAADNDEDSEEDHEEASDEEDDDLDEEDEDNEDSDEFEDEFEDEDEDEEDS
jgi:hypothetical protein